MSVTWLRAALCAAVVVHGVTGVVQAQPARPLVYQAPADAKGDRGPRRLAGDIGTLRMMTPTTRNAVLGRITGERVYDLSVQYFIGLPSWYGEDDLPPIVARGVLIDVAGMKNVAALPDDYRISQQELEAALAAQRVSLKDGDIVLIRGGKITLEAAQWLADTKAAMIIGGDQLSLEAYKYGRPDLTVPVHNYLLTQRGVAIIQVDGLDQLARDKVYEFALIAASLRSRGSQVQFRPLAFPLRPES
jgi:kynurenine formamidase